MEKGNNTSDQNGQEIMVKEKNMSIDERLFNIASNITTIEGWEEYISQYYTAFCSVLAKLETKGNENVADAGNKKPIAVILGGQPGAGKSALIATYVAVLREQYNINAVVNNADFYRFCVPGSYRIADEFPESASRVTDPVVKMMRKNLMEESIAQKQSIIIENTLGDTIVVDKMKQSDVHEIWLALMAVPREESLLSDFERYIKMQETSDVARLVSIEAHDKRYIALDEITKRLEDEGMRIIVHSRGKTDKDFVNVEYDSSSTLPQKYSSAMEAMREVRARTFEEGKATYAQRLKTIRQKMEELGLTPEEEEELIKLEEIIGLVIAKEKEGEER